MDCAKKAMSAALTKGPFDLVIRNVKLVNVFTEEIYPAEIGISGGMVAYVTAPGEGGLSGAQVVEGAGRFAVPGLIDTHVHIESSMMTPRYFSEVCANSGVTTIMADPHEICNVLGKQAFHYMQKDAERARMRILYAVPSCVPAVPGLETSGAEFGPAEIAELMESGGAGLAEVMDYVGVANCSARMSAIVEEAEKHHLPAFGHTPLPPEPILQAYAASGIASCHESTCTEETLAKLRCGMVVECRESSACHDLEALIPALKQLNWPDNACFCTDDKEPDDLLREGSLCNNIRRAVQLGMPAVKAIRMGTLHAARLIRQPRLGAIAPGRWADIVLLDNLEQFAISEVYVEGRLVSKNGKLLEPIERDALEETEQMNTVRLPAAPTPALFTISAKGDTASVHTIQFNDQVPILTTLGTEKLPVKNGHVDISGREDLAFLTVLERHGKGGEHTTCLVKDCGLTHGAVAATISHDCHNLIVLGRDPEQMSLAANRLAECGGGIVSVDEGKVTGLLALPVGGLMAARSVEEMAPDVLAIKQAVRALGMKGQNPIIQPGSFALTVIPEVRVSNLGLVDVLAQKFIPVVAEED